MLCFSSIDKFGVLQTSVPSQQEQNTYTNSDYCTKPLRLIVYKSIINRQLYYIHQHTVSSIRYKCLLIDAMRNIIAIFYTSMADTICFSFLTSPLVVYSLFQHSVFLYCYIIFVSIFNKYSIIQSVYNTAIYLRSVQSEITTPHFIDFSPHSLICLFFFKDFKYWKYWYTRKEGQIFTG